MVRLPRPKRPGRPRLPRGRRGRVVLAAAVVLVLALGVVAWRVVTRPEPSRFAAAARLAPASTIRLLWTDWSAVRREVGSKVSGRSTSDDIESFLDDSFDAGLGSGSVLVDSAAALQEYLGFSPATIDWELSAQDRRSAITLMGLGDDFDIPRLRRTLTQAGFTPPDRPGGIWQGGSDVLSDLPREVTGEVGYLQIDAEAHLLVASNREIDLRERDDDVRGDRDDAVGRLVDAAGATTSASVFTGDYTCAELAMSGADPADRTRGDELIQQAGGVHPLAGYGLAGEPGGDVRFLFAFDDADQARKDADSRAKLASGPAPGQGGTFPDLFAVRRVVASDTVVTMETRPTEGSLLLSDLDRGPVLFASC